MHRPTRLLGGVLAGCLAAGCSAAPPGRTASGPAPLPPAARADRGRHAVTHHPWAYVPGGTAACRSGDVPAGTPSGGALASAVRAGTLPNVGLITPNLINDAHDGTLGQADAWLRRWIPVIM